VLILKIVCLSKNVVGFHVDSNVLEEYIEMKQLNQYKWLNAIQSLYSYFTDEQLHSSVHLHGLVHMDMTDQPTKI
jgi:hypothetical protein